jgi:hypothetical protein
MIPGPALGIVYRQASGRTFVCVGWIRPDAGSMWLDGITSDGGRLEPIEIPRDYQSGAIFRCAVDQYALVVPIHALNVRVDGHMVTLPGGSRVEFPTKRLGGL